MSEVPVATIIAHFGAMPDPRVNRRKRHLLVDIMAITICAVISGADGWVEVQRFGLARLAWFKSFLALPNGIPSHDTFGRVFALLDPQVFEDCFQEWLKTIAQLVRGEVIPIDGKEVRGSQDRFRGQGAIRMVSVWAQANGLVLGQIKVEDCSNEITAMPKLLSLFDLEACIVTADAMGCQKEIAKAILARKGAYVLAVKENQKTLYADLISLFQEAEKARYRLVAHDYCQTTDKGHGRIETRQCWVITDEMYLHYLASLKWPGLRAIVMVVGERQSAGKMTRAVRYYISSLPGSAKTLLRAVRRHWGVENSLHWVLDVAFREDESSVRVGHAAENLSILRRIALNLLKQEKTVKVGIKTKRMMAGWDQSYLLKVLGI
jgi:predicted transposase YbfD/YdcC